MAVEEHKIQSQRFGVRPGDPCLYNLHTSKLLPEKVAVVGVTATQFSDEDFREKLTRDIQEFGRAPFQKELWDWFKPKIYYHARLPRSQSLQTAQGEADDRR
jgi:glucose-6-phosphate 1-dehydrogenase